MNRNNQSQDATLQELGVHKMLELFVTKCMDPFLDSDVRDLEARKLRTMIEENSRHLPSQRSFSELMSELNESGDNLVAQHDLNWKIAGISVLDCLIDINEESVTDRRIAIGNTYIKIFKNDKIGIDAGLILLPFVAKSVGHIARSGGTIEIDYLQGQFLPSTLPYIKNQSNSAFLKLSGCLIVEELAHNVPSLIYIRRREIFGVLCDIVCDRVSVVREAASNTLEVVLELISQRDSSMTDWLSSCLNQVDKWFKVKSSERILGALLILEIVIGGKVVSVQELQSTMAGLGRPHYILINNVLDLRSSGDSDVRMKVINIIPHLANAFQPNIGAFTKVNQSTNPLNFLNFTINYLIDLIKSKQQTVDDNERPLAYITLGNLCSTMSSALRPSKNTVTNPAVSSIIATIKQGFSNDQFFCIQALKCLGLVVNAIPSCRGSVDIDLIDRMFRGGLTQDLVETLKIITKHMPSLRALVQNQLLRHIKTILNSYDVSLKVGPRSGGGVKYGTRGMMGDGAATSTTFSYGAPVYDNSINSTASTSSSTSKVSRKTSIIGNFFSKEKKEKEEEEKSNTGSASNGYEENKDDPQYIYVNTKIDPTSVSDSQLILALQVLASPDFFSKQKQIESPSTNTAHNTISNAHSSVNSLEGAATQHTSSSSSASSNTKGGTDTDLFADKDSSAMLTQVVQDAVVRYLDDYNVAIRKAAVTTCASVLDIVVLNLDHNHTSVGYISFAQILNRLLMLGVADDNESIRIKVFDALYPSLDKLIIESESLHCVIRAINDESTGVRIAAMNVLSRVAHYDPLHIMPEIRLILHRLLVQLQNSSVEMKIVVDHDLLSRLECVQLLQSMVRGGKSLIAPYVDQILSVIFPMLSDNTSAVASSALSTIGELAEASPESIRGLIDDLIVRLIQSLKDDKSMESQETAVEVMAKLLSSLTLVTEDTYMKYPGLFEGLVGIIQSNRASKDLRLKAIQTAGLLGAVDADIYSQQLTSISFLKEDVNEEQSKEKVQDDDLLAQADSSDFRGFEESKKDKEMVYLEGVQAYDKKMTAAEKYYLSVVIKNLLKILRDNGLTTSHLGAASVLTRILRMFGSQASPYLGECIETLTFRLYNIEAGNNLRDALLDNVMSIALVMGRVMRAYVKEMIQLICTFFHSHVKACMDLVECLGLKLLQPDFNIVLNGVLPIILQTLRDEPFEQLRAQTEVNAMTANQQTSKNSDARNTASGMTNSLAVSLFGLVSSNTKTLSLPKINKILQTFVNIREIVNDHKRMIVPAILRLLDNANGSLFNDTRKKVLVTVMYLTDDSHLHEYTNQIVLPILRMIDNYTPTSQQSSSSHAKSSEDNSDDYASELFAAAMTSLCCLVCRIGSEFVPYVIPIRRNLDKIGTIGTTGQQFNQGPPNTNSYTNSQLDTTALWHIYEYENLVSRLLTKKPLPPEPASYKTALRAAIDPKVREKGFEVKLPHDHYKRPKLSDLEQAWALAGRNNATDLVEWMRRLSNELIRNSPNPVIRACASLCKNYPPLLDELFTPCFVCMWNELFLAYSKSVVDENSLIQGIELALKSPHISPNMMNSLLQLAEFMDMHDKRLPIDITLLGRCAEGANMYAKALHYRELQFNSVNLEPNSECIEALITVNNQLGSEDRAIGVLDHVINAYPHISVEPLWLEELKQWRDAKDSYVAINEGYNLKYPEDSPPKVSGWLNSELGVLRCTRALGEFHQLAAKALELREHLKSHEQSASSSSNTELTSASKQVKKLGANAAWMLSKWDVMDQFLYGDTSDSFIDDNHVVDVTNNVSFYKTVLAIHKEDYSMALDLIEQTRSELANTISSLLSEGYTRAYKAMVTMQILSELEEVVDFKRSSSRILARSQVDDSAYSTSYTTTNTDKSNIVNMSAINMNATPYGNTAYTYDHNGDSSGARGDLYVPRVPISASTILLEGGYDKNNKGDGRGTMDDYDSAYRKSNYLQMLNLSYQDVLGRNSISESKEGSPGGGSSHNGIRVLESSSASSSPVKGTRGRETPSTPSGGLGFDSPEAQNDSPTRERSYSLSLPDGSNVTINDTWNSSEISSSVLAAQYEIANRKAALIRKWRRRLKWAPKDVNVYRQILSVHTLVAEPSEDLDSWLELIKLARKEGMFSLCENLLLRLNAPIALKHDSSAQSLLVGSQPAHGSTLFDAQYSKDNGLGDSTTSKGNVSKSPTSESSLGEGGLALSEGSVGSQDIGLSLNDSPVQSPVDRKMVIEDANTEEVTSSGSAGKQQEDAVVTTDQSEKKEGETVATEEGIASEEKNGETDADGSAGEAQVGEASGDTTTKGANDGNGNTSTRTRRGQGGHTAEDLVTYSMYKVLWYSGEKHRALTELSSFINGLDIDSSSSLSTGAVLKKNLAGLEDRKDDITRILSYAAKRGTSATTATSESSSSNDTNSEGSASSIRAATIIPSLSISGGYGLPPSMSSVLPASPVKDGNHNSSPNESQRNRDRTTFQVKCLLKKAEWMRELNEAPLTDILNTVMLARTIAEDRYSVWHAWAVTNYDQLQKLALAKDTALDGDADAGAASPSATVVSAVDTDVSTPAMHPSRGSSTNSSTSSTSTGRTSRQTSYSTSTSFNAISESTKSKSGRPASERRSRHYTHQLATTNNALVPRTSRSTSTMSTSNDRREVDVEESEMYTYVVEAIKGFIRSIILGHGRGLAHVLQDTLRLLTLWFQYGTHKKVYKITSTEIEHVAPDCWLQVLPQLIARMYSTNPEIYQVLLKLLCKVGLVHPQALVCPISVARNTQNAQQKTLATKVINEMRKHSSQLVEEATMVSRELMRVAISPHELWKTGLETAFAQYMSKEEVSQGVKINAMVSTLSELHEAMTEGGAGGTGLGSVFEDNISGNNSLTKIEDEGFAEGSGNIGSATLRDISFRHSFGRQLAEAKDLLTEFKKTGLVTTLHQLWSINTGIIYKMDKSLLLQSKVQLHHVSRQLTNSRNLMLCVPGTYQPNEKVVSISKFVNNLTIITSKQRPRRMAILGSDGKIYEFLLKGKEDLRQDERVMQLFGLINVCLESDRSTSRQRLNIVKYSVLPLSNNSGVIGWVQNCDTFYSLLATYRTERGIPLTLEPQLLKQQFGGDRKYLDRYDKLPSVNKVEIFQNILDQTTGSDLEKMLYWKSKTADVWVGRRDTFTRSMAVMSIVGYILGLGDRHMANIMLDRVTGTVIHIDFGDCFEINKTRSMYPETVPFRLTRMLTKCMGTSGMTGTFKKTAYRVMRVLHENRDSVMAMLEAFVYDPMVSWRVLVDKSQLVDGQPVTTTTIQPVTASMGDTTTSNTGTSNNGSEVSISDNKLIPSTNTDESESRMDSGMAPSMADLLTNTQGYSLSEVALASYADHTATGLDINSGITNTDTAERGEDMNELLLSSLRQSMTLSQSQYMKQKAHHFESQQHQLDGNAVPIGSLRNTLEAPPTHTLRGSIHGDVVLGAGILGPGVAPAMPMSTTNVNSGVLSLHNQADTTAVNQTAAEPLQENLNARALEVINRIHSKLTGRDFATSDDDIEMSVEEQVNRLIHEATSVENLASLWIGWNPWW